MDKFEFHNPTKIFFGENCVAEHLKNQLELEGSNVLLTYGGGSIKKNGIYDAVIKALRDANKTVVELSGIMANPRSTKVQEGIDLCHMYNIDFILAVGGGSVIDCSKFIAAGAALEGKQDFWKYYFIDKHSVQKSLPLGTVLTMSGTGSEMNSGGVISNWETQEKLSARGPAAFPKFSLLDPTYTYSLPREQMIYGTVDMLSHLMEQYFCKPDEENVTDDLIEAIFKSIMKNVEVALQDPTNYVARSNMMWNATLSLNGLLRMGKGQDWMSHMMEHALSAFHDIPHGAGLAIVHPMFLQYIYKDHLPRFVRFAKHIWGIDGTGKSDEEIALEGVLALRAYFKSLGAPITLKEVHIPREDLRKIAETVVRFKTSYTDLTVDDIVNIYESAYE